MAQSRSVRIAIVGDVVSSPILDCARVYGLCVGICAAVSHSLTLPFLGLILDSAHGSGYHVELPILELIKFVFFFFFFAIA